FDEHRLSKDSIDLVCALGEHRRPTSLHGLVPACALQEHGSDMDFVPHAASRHSPPNGSSTLITSDGGDAIPSARLETPIMAAPTMSRPAIYDSASNIGS